ncbi:MAG: transglutaminase-like cysteine peptidase [Candidatus Sedimenticola sp. (ex Thyasira tokunagai)]
MIYSNQVARVKINRVQMQLIRGINASVNAAIHYRHEGDRDEWQAPPETLSRGAGDCEDIALLKMHLLLQIVPAEDLRLLWVKTGGGLAHMVLGVRSESACLVLDNRSNSVVTLEESEYGVPVYSIDGLGQVYARGGSLTAARVGKFDGAMDRTV